MLDKAIINVIAVILLWFPSEHGACFPWEYHDFIDWVLTSDEVMDSLERLARERLWLTPDILPVPHRFPPGNKHDRRYWLDILRGRQCGKWDVLDPLRKVGPAP